MLLRLMATIEKQSHTHHPPPPLTLTYTCWGPELRTKRGRVLVSATYTMTVINPLIRRLVHFTPPPPHLPTAHFTKPHPSLAIPPILTSTKPHTHWPSLPFSPPPNHTLTGLKAHPPLFSHLHSSKCQSPAAPLTGTVHWDQTPPPPLVAPATPLPPQHLS